MTDALWWGIAIALGYLLGSIPFGLLIGLSRGVDPRTVGSGNIGATNVSRALGKRWGRICFALDFLKGLLPPLVTGLAMGVARWGPIDHGQAWWWLGTMAAPIVGHVFPVWLKFKGGKGVATGFGAMLGVWPVVTWPALVVMGVWVACHRLTRNVGLSSCIAAALLPIVLALLEVLTRPEGMTPMAALWGASPFLIVTGALAALVLVRHTDNLLRTFGFRPPRKGGPFDPARGEGERGPGRTPG